MTITAIAPIEYKTWLNINFVHLYVQKLKKILTKGSQHFLYSSYLEKSKYFKMKNNFKKREIYFPIILKSFILSAIYFHWKKNIYKGLNSCKPCINGRTNYRSAWQQSVPFFWSTESTVYLIYSTLEVWTDPICKVGTTRVKSEREWMRERERNLWRLSHKKIYKASKYPSSFTS